MDNECKTCGGNQAAPRPEDANGAVPHPMGEVVPNTGGEVFARTWTPAEEAAVNVRLSRNNANQISPRIPPLAVQIRDELIVQPVKHLASYSGPPWLSGGSAEQIELLPVMGGPQLLQENRDEPSLHADVAVSVEYLSGTQGAPWFQAVDADGEPKVKVGKIPKDELPKPAEKETAPPKEGRPAEGGPSNFDFPKAPADSDSNTATSAPTKTDNGPVLVQGDDETNFKDWWEGSPDLPSGKVELKCGQRVRHRVHLSWSESGTVGQVPDIDDAKKLSKGKIAASSAKSIASKNISNGVLDTKVKEFLVDVQNWTCEAGCKLNIRILASQYSVKIGTQIQEVIDQARQHVGWLVLYYVVHELWAVVEIECNR